MSTGLSNAEVSDLYRRYGFFLRRRCCMIVRDPSSADDALQEAFVKVMKSGGPLREMEHPLRWLHRVVDRCCFDQLRRGKHLRVASQLDTMTDAATPQQEDGVEERDAIVAILRDLDDGDKQIAVLAFMDGMSQGEIADEVGFSRVTVNKKVQAIRARAAKMMDGTSAATPQRGLHQDGTSAATPQRGLHQGERRS